MIRIAGIDLPEEKTISIALTKIYGIGRRNVAGLLAKTKVEKSKRVKALSAEEVAKLQKEIDASFRVEGDLRKEVSDNINRLKQISSYRGRRHVANLPVRGQRTRTNARTKRGKRVTIGALKKEVLNKMDQVQKTAEKK